MTLREANALAIPQLMPIAKRCLIAGRVQGVFYRATTRLKALELGVQGHAKNLPDGRVEVLACGETEQIEQFVQWLWQGSPASHVTEVQVEDVAIAALESVPHTFSTR